MFVENMSAGKGFLAVSAARIGMGDPLRALLACFIFSYADALSVSLQSINIPSQIVLLAPYLVTVVVGSFWEGLFNLVRGHEISEAFLVTSLLFPLTLPATTLIEAWTELGASVA